MLLRATAINSPQICVRLSENRAIGGARAPDLRTLLTRQTVEFLEILKTLFSTEILEASPGPQEIKQG